MKLPKGVMIQARQGDKSLLTLREVGHGPGRLVGVMQAAARQTPGSLLSLPVRESSPAVPALRGLLPKAKKETW